MLTGDEVVPAFRAVSECFGSADLDTRDALLKEVNERSRARWFDHDQITAIADWLGNTDTQLHDAFVAELLKVDPKLANVLNRRP